MKYDDILNHYRSTSVYTYAGPYNETFKNLPDDLEEFCELICNQHIQRFILMGGNDFENKDMRFGDMNLYPWYRMRCEDDVLVTAASMVGEIYRLNDNGFTNDRDVKDRVILSCRHITVLVAAALKAKGVPCRCRAGFREYEEKPVDHWLNQYWNQEQNRWVTFDPEGYLYMDVEGYTKYDIPDDQFQWAAKTWIDYRNDVINGDSYLLLDGTKSAKAIAKVLIYDFHALMNDEISYPFIPYFIDNKKKTIDKAICDELDQLASYMLKPEENFVDMNLIWESNRKFRVLNGPLITTMDNRKVIFG